MLLPFQATAQTGTCEPALAEAELDIGNVRARIFNNGGLFWRGSPHVYEVPKGEGSSALFAANIWISGLIDNQVRVAGSRFGPREFWPGPIDVAGNPPADCSPYDQIWEITWTDLFDWFEFGTISTNLANWPWHLGAPVIDGDGVHGNYNLEGGDFPELLGHQRLWWIMNDRGNTHESTDSQPLGLEVHGSAYAFPFPEAAKNHTFYTHKVINKNTVPITDLHFTFWTDGDLGNFDDDYVGSDTLLGLAYYYNADNFDEGGEGYGEAPPAVGFLFLETPPATGDGLDNNRNGETDEPGEMLGPTLIMNHQKSGRNVGGPQTLQQYFNYARGIWRDGSPMFEGSIGYADAFWPDGLPQIPTRYYMPGDPLTGAFWSEFNGDNAGNAIAPSDRRLHMSTGPITLAPGDTMTVSTAILWARGEDHLDSVRQLKADTPIIINAAAAILSPSVSKNPDPRQPNNPPPGTVLNFEQNFPNPFKSTTTIRYSLPQSMRLRLAVYNTLGQEVAVLVENRQAAGNYSAAFNADNLPAGVYLARFEVNQLQFTRRMLLVK